MRREKHGSSHRPAAMLPPRRHPDPLSRGLMDHLTVKLNLRLTCGVRHTCLDDKSGQAWLYITPCHHFKLSWLRSLSPHFVHGAIQTSPWLAERSRWACNGRKLQEHLHSLATAPRLRHRSYQSASNWPGKARRAQVVARPLKLHAETAVQPSGRRLASLKRAVRRPV